MRRVIVDSRRRNVDGAGRRREGGDAYEGLLERKCARHQRRCRPVLHPGLSVSHGGLHCPAGQAYL